ncbi:MAG: hypothetical protein PHU69_14730 [Fermentimonas sp.]|nr:hypothetical protein [Fermentimonas sp.]
MRGFISKQIFTDGYINDDGIPVPGSTDWGADVECKYFATENNNKGRYIDGDFKQIAFEITTEDMSFDANIIRLKDRKGNVVCEKEVQSLEELENVQRIKITV